MRIQNELQARGIAADLIENHLKITDSIWLTQARRVWQKHFKNKPSQNFKARAKQIRFLQNRGFAYEHIVNIIHEENEIM
jgi:regulatory protein